MCTAAAAAGRTRAGTSFDIGRGCTTTATAAAAEKISPIGVAPCYVY